MTVLIDLSSHFGIVAAADSRWSWPGGVHPPLDGRRKLVPWPAMCAVVGYAGRATVHGKPVDEIVQDLIGSRPGERPWGSLDEYAVALAAALEPVSTDPVPGDRRIYVQIAGFGPPGPGQIPQVHYVRNADGNNTTARFMVGEDLRDTKLRPRGIVTLADYLDPAKTNFALAQFSGQRREIGVRLGALFMRDMNAMRGLEDVANWAAGKVRSVARARPGQVGGDVSVWKITPDAVERHETAAVEPMPNWRAHDPFRPR